MTTAADTTAQLKRLLRTRHNLLQAPMAGVQDSRLAVAVCRAGGLGALPGAMLSAEGLKRECAALRAATDAPYNLNFFCHTPEPADAAADEAWRRLLAPYATAYGLDPAAPAPATANRAPFSAETAALLEALRPPVVSFHFGLPDARLVAQVKGWGTVVLASATTVDEGRWLQAHGADAVIAQGLEAGGHRGMFLSTDLNTQMGTFALVPALVAALDVPVIAAGGIADAAGVRAACALGAAGVQVGTRFLCCDEAQTSALHRAELLRPGAVTALTNVFTGRPARGIVNRLMRELGPMHPAAPAFPRASLPLAALRAAAEATGTPDFSPLWAGQAAHRCRAESAADTVAELVRGFAPSSNRA